MFQYVQMNFHPWQHDMIIIYSHQGRYLALKSWGGGQIIKNSNSAAYMQATAMYFRGLINYYIIKQMREEILFYC